jgi:hypothetical protein
MLAISIEDADDIGKVREVMKKYSFPAALASASEIQGLARPWRIPITYVIDRRGALRFDGSKLAKTLDARALQKIVGPLLREPKGAAAPVKS